MNEEDESILINEAQEHFNTHRDLYAKSGLTPADIDDTMDYLGKVLLILAERDEVAMDVAASADNIG